MAYSAGLYLRVLRCARAVRLRQIARRALTNSYCCPNDPENAIAESPYASCSAGGIDLLVLKVEILSRIPGISSFEAGGRRSTCGIRTITSPPPLAIVLCPPNVPVSTRIGAPGRGCKATKQGYCHTEPPAPQTKPRSAPNCGKSRAQLLSQDHSHSPPKLTRNFTRSAPPGRLIFAFFRY